MPKKVKSWKVLLDGHNTSNCKVFYGKQQIGFVNSMTLTVDDKCVPELTLKVTDPRLFINSKNIGKIGFKCTECGEAMTCPECIERKKVIDRSW